MPGLSLLSSPESGFASIGPQENPCEHDLFVTRRDKRTCFFGRVFDALAPQCGSKPGDDAVCAMCVAAILHLQVRALSAGLVIVEDGKCVCADNPNRRFSLDRPGP